MVCIHVQVSNDEWYQSNFANEPTAEDSTSSDRMLVHNAAALHRQPSQYSRGPSEDLAGDSRDSSTAAMLSSASLLSYNAVTPRLRDESLTPVGTVQL